MKNVVRISGKIHQAADGKKLEVAKKELAKLKAQVDLFDKQFAHSHKPGAAKPVGTKPIAIASAVCLAVALGGCIPMLSSGELRAQADTPPTGANCSSCHRYDLKDMNHVYHITYAEIYVKRVNGTVTCLDCHWTSIRYTPVTVLDSIYRDSVGIVRSLLDYPLRTDLREGLLLRIDTLVQNHPLPSPRVVARPLAVQEWMTGLAHLNGRMDAVFDSSVSDPDRFQGARAEFHPAQETCSAIRCHEHPNPYRFAAPSKGLPGLTGVAIQ